MGSINNNTYKTEGLQCHDMLPVTLFIEHFHAIQVTSENTLRKTINSCMKAKTVLGVL